MGTEMEEAILKKQEMLMEIEKAKGLVTQAVIDARFESSQRELSTAKDREKEAEAMRAIQQQLREEIEQTKKTMLAVKEENEEKVRMLEEVRKREADRDIEVQESMKKLRLRIREAEQKPTTIDLGEMVDVNKEESVELQAARMREKSMAPGKSAVVLCVLEDEGEDRESS